MSSAGGDWRTAAAYDYFDDLSPAKVAHEFLRRNDEYAADYAMIAMTASDELTSALSRWGCDFAADPKLRADQATIVWLPKVNPRLTVLLPLSRELFDGPDLAAAAPVAVASTTEGDYLDLLALPPSHEALLLYRATAGDAVGLVLPLDALFEDRVENARRLLAFLKQGRRAGSTFSTYRRRRLKLALRALDASLDGADYRAIAHALFGDRVPLGAAFRDDSLRAQAIRLVRYGLHLMKGGYLDLLRPERRARRRPRSRRG